VKLNRRDILKIGMLQWASSLIPLTGSSQDFQALPSRQGLSILQGATDDTSTQFSILLPVSLEAEIFVTNSQGERWHHDRAESFSRPGEPYKIIKVKFSGLSAGEDFQLQVLEQTSSRQIDIRDFQVMNLKSDTVRFAICSCLYDKDHEPAIWRTLIKQKPQVILFIGDSVYADKGADRWGATPLHLWRRFCEARLTLEIYYSRKLIPILAVWDDHDFGADDGGAETYPYVKESQENFMQFFAQDESHCRWLSRGPGVSSAIHLGSQLFLLLDDRSFRKRQGSTDRYAHWGEKQENWFLDLISRNPGPTWLFNGSQIFPMMLYKESVSGDHKEQFHGLLKKLKSLSSRVIFGSGDVHFSEISKIEKSAVGYPTYEITSSSMHSRGIPGAPDLIPNWRRTVGTGQRNFVLIESTAQGHGAQFSATSLGKTGQVLFRENLTV
jgi:alkaline phosphatase D